MKRRFHPDSPNRETCPKDEPPSQWEKFLLRKVNPARPSDCPNRYPPDKRRWRWLAARPDRHYVRTQHRPRCSRSSPDIPARRLFPASPPVCPVSSSPFSQLPMALPRLATETARAPCVPSV